MGNTLCHYGGKMKKVIKILFSTFSVFIFVLFVGAYLTLYFELKDPNANITSYYDSLWWCLNASSIGDSNVFPITIPGRIIGAFLIIIGYGLFTINVGTISAVLTHLIRDKRHDEVLKQVKDFLTKNGHK